MELNTDFNDLKAIDEDPQSFTQEELDTIFKKTQEEIHNVYLETLGYFAGQVKRQRPRVYTVSDLLGKLSSIKNLATAKYTVSAINTERVILVHTERIANLQTLVQSLTEAMDNFSNPQVYYKNDKGEVLPLDIDKVGFRTPPTQLEMTIED
jgi:hypothetical protein